MISDSEAIEITRKIENADFDIKKTIEKASDAGYLADKQYYATVIQDASFTYPVGKILGDNYPEIKLDNLYFDIISKALDGEGIYISIAHCNPDFSMPDDLIDEVIEYDDYELEEDDLEYLRQYCLLTTDSVKLFKIYEEEGISGHKLMEDMGLMVKFVDGKCKSCFALRSTDLCMSTLRVLPLSADYPKEHELSVINPINKLLIKMIWDAVVF